MQMLDHLKNQCTVRTLDVDKLESALNDPWGMDDHITKYFSKMKIKTERLESAGITGSNDQANVSLWTL